MIRHSLEAKESPKEKEGLPEKEKEGDKTRLDEMVNE